MTDVELALFAEITPTTTVLTPNRRIAATLHANYLTYQSKQNAYWLTPDILPLNSWLERLWFESTMQGLVSTLLLTPTQTHFLWEKILSQSPQCQLFLQIAETVDDVKSAYRLLKQWQIDLQHPLFQSTDDSSALYDWILQFEQICQEQHWIDANSIPSKLLTLTLPPPLKIIFVGFVELWPELHSLITQFKARGTEIQFVQLHTTQPQATRLALSDQENELITMARWAKTCASQHKKARIACVIPMLDKIRDRVEQIFAEVFLEEKAFNVNPENRPFNLSAGKALSHYPLIQAALRILSLNTANITNEQFGALLASPFIGEAESEHIKRAKFDAYLRKNNMNRMNVSDLIKNAGFFDIERYCPQFKRRLQKFFEILQNHQRAYRYDEWATIFTELLTAFGWPGEQSLNSEEFQTAEQWLTLLGEYQTLAQVSAEVGYQEALHTLKKCAERQLFQPKSPETNVQVLGLLEAAGLPFDYIWVSGMDDLAWPSSPHPNPFIPKRLQREQEMPHSTAAREYSFSKMITDQFKQSAPIVIFSHAEKKEEVWLEASALIQDLPAVNIASLTLDPFLSFVERVQQSRSVEKIIDKTGPHINAEQIRGGINVIKLQALCPFRAFAEWRLFAKELEQTKPGFKQKDRGSLIHKALEILWAKLKEQETLLASTQERLDCMIQEAISQAFTRYPYLTSHHGNYLALEKERLRQVLGEWLEIEKTRPHFKVLSQEQEATITLDKLKLNIKIDRIDELENGKKLIIDYKTGSTNDIHHWLGERPEEPQLPVYALLDPDHTVGICYAELYRGQQGFKGISANPVNIKGIRPISEVKKIEHATWNDQLQQWRSVLTSLSASFQQGFAEINPKEKEQTCHHCQLGPLCRINESRDQ